MAVAEKYPQYTNGIAVYSKNEKNSYCYVCPSKLPIASEEHLKNTDHLSTLAYYLHNFTDNGPFVNCKLCSMWLEYSSIKEHAITHKLMPWYRPEEEFKIFYVNWISSKNNEYYCHLCDVKLLSWFHAIFHTEETKHRALRGDKINEAAIKKLPFTWSHYQEVVNLASFMGTSESSMCALCCVPSGTLHNEVLKHSEHIIHIINEEALKEIMKKAPIHVPPITGSFDYNYYLNRVDDSADNNSDERMMQISLSFCIICHKVIDSGRIEAHLEIHADDLSDSIDNAREGSTKKDGCDVLGKNKAIFQNISFPINKKMKPCEISSKENKADGAKEDNCHQCSCSMKLCRDEDLELHSKILRKSDQFRVRRIDRECKTSINLQSKTHDLLRTQDTDAGENSLLPEGIHYFFPVYKCTLCDYDIGERINIKSHIDTYHHQSNLQLQRENKEKMPNNNELKSSLGPSSETSANGGAKVVNEANAEGLPEGVLFLFNSTYRCTLCKCHLCGRMNIQQHVDTARHQKKLRLWKEENAKILGISADALTMITQNDQPLPRDIVMTDNPNFFWCKTCSLQISGYKCTLQHIKGANHKNNKLGLSTSTSNISSNSSTSNSKINSNKALTSTITTKESLKKSDSEKKNDQSLPSSSGAQVNCSPAQEVNVEGNETSTVEKKKPRTRGKKEIIDTANIVTASIQKIQQVETPSSSVNKIEACEIYPEKKKSPGKDNSFKCDSCNIKLRGYAELLSHVMADKCKLPTNEGVIELESYKFVETLPGKFKITKFVGGKEVEAVDIPEEFLRVTRRTYYCLSCQCNLVGGESIFKHATAAAHGENIVKRIEDDKNYIFAETSTGKRKILRFIEGKEVEAVDIPEIFMRITNTNYYCLSCCCNLNGGAAILKHVKAPAHGKDLIEKNGEANSVDKSFAIDEKSGLFGKSADVRKLSPHTVSTEKEDEKKNMNSLNEPENYKFTETSPGNFRITRFFEGKEVEAVDIPDKFIRFTRRNYYCLSCNCDLMGGESIFKHAKTHKEDKKDNLMNKSVAIDGNSGLIEKSADVKKLPPHIVSTEKDNVYWCEICSAKIASYKCIAEHENGSRHKRNINLPNEPETYKFAETSPGQLKIIRFVGEREVECVDIPEKFMRITNTNYYCLVCGCNLNGGESIFKHVKTAHEKDVIKKDKEDKCINKSAAIDGKSGLIENFTDVQKLPPYIVATDKKNVHWCQICSTEISKCEYISGHENGLNHTTKINSLNRPDSYIFYEEFPGNMKIKRFVNGKEVETVDIPGTLRRSTRKSYYCLLCSSVFRGCELIFKHIKDAAHGENLIKKNEEDKRMNKSAVIDGKSGLIETSADVQKLPPHIVATADENLYWCQICSTQINSYKNILDHENGVKHKENMNPVDLTFDQSLFPDITVIPEKRNEFWCKVCSVRICGPKTVVQHVNAPKHMQQVKDQLNLPGVSDKRNGESIPITADGINWKINDYLSLSSASREKYELRNEKIGLDSIAGRNDGKLNKNKELMSESVKSIYSPGDEVFMTECRICKEIILGNLRSVAKHANSKRHEEKQEFVSYLQGPEFVLEMEPKLNKHDEFKYFIADKQIEGDESVINVVEVPKGATKDFGIYFTWCNACCVKNYDDFRLNEHLKSPFHLKNLKEKFIISKSLDGKDDNDDSESNEKDQHKNYPEGIKEIHGEDYFLCTICYGVKLFDKNSVFEHGKSLVHLNNLQRSLGSGETVEDDAFFNEINWKTSEKSTGREETAAQSLFSNSQSKNAGGSSSENDFFSCSSEEDSKINAGPSEAQIVTSMARMNLNSNENEKASEDIEVPFSEGSCSSLSYGQRDDDDWIQLCPGSDGSVDYYRMGDEYVDLEDEFSVSESASTSQTPEIASTSQIPKNIRVPEKQTAASLGETYNIEGTDLWVCLVCQNYRVYPTKTISSHITSIQHSNWRIKKSFIAPKPLNNTNFIISSKFQSEGIVAIPTKTFAVCTFCSCKLTTEAKANEHISTAKHQEGKMKLINKKKESTLNSSVPFSLQRVLPDGIEKFSNKDFLLCTICRKKLLESEIEEHIRDFNHIQNGKTLIVKINEDEFLCKRCGIILSGYLALVNHLNTSGHNNIPDPPKKNLNFSENTNMEDQEKIQCRIFVRKLKKNPQKVYDDLKFEKKKIPNFIKILPEGMLMIEKINTNWCMTCNCFLSMSDWKPHFSGKRHKETLERNELLNQDNQIFHCELCRRDVIGKKNWEHHTLFAEHKRNERALLEALSAEASDTVSVESPRRIQPMISNFQLAESDNSLEEEETFGSSKPGGAKISQKYQPMVDCNICHCKVPGGDANISNHRNSREHKDNEAKLFAKPVTPADTGNSVGNVSVNPRSFNANIPLDAYSQYHYRNDSSIDFIECKVCNLNIHGIGDISANYVYAFHMQSEVHKIKEIEFAKKWRPSPVPSTSGSQSSMKSSKSSDKLSSSRKKELTKKRGLRRSGVLKLLQKFDGSKAICPICHEILKSKDLLHSHMTSHFWERFVKNPPPITEKLPEKSAKSEPSRSTEDADEELVINESPMKPLKRTHFRRKPLDIEVTDSANIYETDKQKMSEIKAGVLLSLSKDEDSIYCLICRCNVSNNLQTFYEHLCSVKHLDYLKDMLDDDKLFQNSENQFSDLALGYEYMEDISDTAIKCHACNISVNNKFSKLNKHINSASHIDKWTALDVNSRDLFRGLKSKMECDFYSVRWYWCVICNLKFITECEFQKHLMQKKHLKETRKFGDEFLMFDYCGVCASLWYGFLKTFSYHSDCKMHKYHKLDGFFSIDKLPESAVRLVNSAEEEIGVTLRDLDLRRAIDKNKEDQLLRDLREIAVVKYPNAVVHPFGSRITRLGGKNSDLDVFLDCPTQKSCMYFGENSHPELIERRLVKIKESLENNTNIWHIDREILDCRIPIIKTKHKPTDIECDLSFTNGLTVENTALIRNYCDKSTDCRKLIIFIKNWMNHCELSGANGINSYGIAWLVIYFLQTKKILPTVNQLIEMNNKSQIIAGWETGVSKDFQVQTFAGSFEELLNDFFKFYGNFDYRHDVICPLLGEIVKKIDFQHRGKLPSTMGPYLNYLYDTGDAEPFRVDSIMCLQDPFDLAHNITKVVKKFHIHKFKTFCCYSAEILDNNH